MFGTIRKHQEWLWYVIIVAIVVSFVIYFTPTSRVSDSWGEGGNFGSIKGRPITREEYSDCYREAMLVHLFNYGEWPEHSARRTSFDTDREARNRLLLVEKMKDLGIRVSDEAVAQYKVEMPTFHARNSKEFNREMYDQFIKERLPEGSLTAVDFDRFVRHEIGIQQLVAVAGVPGRLITPREAEEQYRAENEQVEAAALLFTAGQQLTNVVVAPDALHQFYTNRMAFYRVPEKAQVSYVKFDVTNFLAEATAKLAANTNLAERIDAAYLQAGAAAFTDTNGTVLAPDAAKARLKELVTRQEAVLAARRRAIEFATALVELKPEKAENLDVLAATNGLTVQISEPFAEYESPRGLRMPDTFARTVFKLTAEEPILSSPVVTTNAVFVAALKRRIPSEMPPLDVILDRVTEDFRRSRAQELAQEAGRAFAAKITNGLAAGKTFDAVCAEEKAEPIKLPPFSSQTRTLPNESRFDLPLLKDVASKLQPGKTSDFTPSRQGGFILHVRARTPVTEAQVKAGLPEYMKTLRQSRQYEAFSEWMRRETEALQLMAPVTESKAK